MEFPQKIKMKLHFDPAIPVLGLYRKNPETPIQKNLCTLMFIATLLQYPSATNSLSAHQQMSGSKNCGTFTQWNLHSREKEGAPTLCNSMDGTGEHYAK